METNAARDIVVARFDDANIVPITYESERVVICGYMVKTSRYDDSIGCGNDEEAAWNDAAWRITLRVPAEHGSPIVVWRFREAPEALQELSPHGGDEDWLAFIPEKYADDWIGWLEHGPFGVCDISRHPVAGGEVRIGAHA